VVNAPYILGQDTLLSLVCGYTDEIRRRLLLMMLSCFSDESDCGNATSLFVVAGCAAPALKWIEFSKDWQSVLMTSPAVDFYRMSNFHSPKWQTAYGISEKDALGKERLLAEVLVQHLSFGNGNFVVCSTIPQPDFFELIGNTVSGRHRFKRNDELIWLRSPYYFCYADSVFNGITAIRGASFEEGTSMSSYVDENGLIADKAAALFFAIKKSNSGLRPYMETSSPLDDKKTPAIQAADLVAGHLRQWYQEQHMTEVTEMIASLNVKTRHWTREAIGAMANELWTRRDPREWTNLFADYSNRRWNS